MLYLTLKSRMASKQLLIPTLLSPLSKHYKHIKYVLLHIYSIQVKMRNGDIIIIINGPSLIPGIMRSLLLLIHRSEFDSRNDTIIITHSTVIVTYLTVTVP